MSIADIKYKKLINKILDNGVWDTDGEVRPVYTNGEPAHSKSIFGEQVKFEKGEIPVITSKKTPIQSSINEVVHAFFRLKTNDVTTFEELGVGYWKEWADGANTIGDSYGRQLAKQKEWVTINEEIGWKQKLNQVDAILHRLEHDPYSRRIMFSYWRPDDVDKKSLQECVWGGQFNVRNDQLDFVIFQRSVDSLLGLPSNWAGYYALQCALANLFDYEVGTFTHQMGNVHLYDNQINLAEELISEPEYGQPDIYVNPNIENFYDYGLDDIKYINYKHGKSFRSEVAI